MSPHLDGGHGDQGNAPRPDVPMWRVKRLRAVAQCSALPLPGSAEDVIMSQVRLGQDLLDQRGHGRLVRGIVGPPPSESWSTSNKAPRRLLTLVSASATSQATPQELPPR